MTSRLTAWLESLGDQFWLRPAVVVAFCLVLAHGMVLADHADLLGPAVERATLIYSGGADGARTILGAIASSAIGVASTIFSITIAALSLASGQMGPRLLRNFVRDGRNQYALGIFLGSFAYALIVLRTVRSGDEYGFVPNIAVTGALLLALVCIGTLTWYVHHIAASINIERVVDAVHADFVRAIGRHTRTEPDVAEAAPIGGTPVAIEASNFVQAVDAQGLASWAKAHHVRIGLRVRPGDYVPSSAPIANVEAASDAAAGTMPDVEEVAKALARHLTLGRKPAAAQDVEFSVRQLNEIAVRALSSGINDPFTAGSVLERYGDALCRLAPRFLPSGTILRDGTIVLTMPVTDYDGLCDAMFHTIRQNTAGSSYVLIRLVEVLTRVAEVERAPERQACLRRHVELIREEAERSLVDAAGRSDLAKRIEVFMATLAGGSTALAGREPDPATS